MARPQNHKHRTLTNYCSAWLGVQDTGLKPPEKHPLWQLRSKEEAQAFWQEEFGHLSSDDGEDEEKPSRWTTYFSAPASE